MRRVWAEVFSPAGEKLGSGHIQLAGVSVTRLLDGAGTVTVDVPGMNLRARSLLTAQRRVLVYQGEPGAAPRLVGQGIVGKAGKGQSPSGWSLDIDGPDLLAELKDYNTLFNRQYNNVPLEDVITELAALAGWSAEVEPSDVTVVARFDWVSVLKALQTIQKNNGLHLRLGDDERTLEFGAFGQDAGITVKNVETGGATSDDIAIIESIRVVEDSEKIFNMIFPVGSGEGEATVTLAKSTRPWVRSMAGADGRTIYYVSDEDSIAAYGVKQKPAQYKDIAPLTNSEASKIEAANALADATLADLAWNSQPQRTYSVTLRKCRRTLKPGDTVRLMYSGPMRFDDGHLIRELPDERIDARFYITKVMERLTPTSSTVSLEISNIDRGRQDAAAAVMEAVERIEQRNLKPQRIQQTMVFHYKDHYSDLSNSTSEWEIPITENLFSEVISVKLRIRLVRASFGGYVELTGGNFWASYYFTRSLLYAKLTADIGWQTNGTPPVQTIERNLVTAGGDVNTGYYAEFDVTNDFLNSAGGLYCTHLIRFTGVATSIVATDLIRINGAFVPAVLVPPSPINYATGEVAADLIFVGIVQSNAPA
ncbi:MAG: hypothetical protein E6Q97_12165 [Desulfurellales bacterium]|nr:MAG: hypothetical protein E6Q97_12165 [Desulfurellales bacterium]